VATKSGNYRYHLLYNVHQLRVSLAQPKLVVLFLSHNKLRFSKNHFASLMFVKRMWCFLEVEETKCNAPVGSASHSTRGSRAPGRLWHPSHHLLGSELRRRGAPPSIALFSASCSAELPGATADGNIVVGADRHSASVSGSNLAELHCC